MSKTTKVKMLDTVEDSNVFRPDELDGTESHPFILAQSLRTEGTGEDAIVIAVNRVDKIPAGVVIDLPSRQAANLVKLGFAEVASA